MWFRFSRDGPSLAFKWSSLFLHKETKIAACAVAGSSEKCGLMAVQLFNTS